MNTNMAKLSEYYERELKRIAGTEGADSYGKWLSAQGKSTAGAADAARQSAATEAARGLVGYGLSGERLSRTGLADDGYADYLRAAAKEAREARVRAIEGERASSEREALAGYADYLEGVRRERGERLIDAAEDLLSLDKYNEESIKRIIGNATTDTRARDLLSHIRASYDYIPSDASRTDVSSVISRIRTMGYNEDRAYRYCKLMGYSDERAREIALFATEDYKDLSKELSDLFGD